MIFERKKKNFLQQKIDNYQTKKRNQIIKQAFLGDKKSINLIKKNILNKGNNNKLLKTNLKFITKQKISQINNNIKNNIVDNADKYTVKNKLLALEGALQQQQKIENTNTILKKIFINPFKKKGRKSLQDYDVKGYYRTIKSKVNDSTNVKITTNLDKFSALPGQLTKSANATKIVSDGKNKYVMKSSSAWEFTEKLFKKAGINYERKYNMPVTEALLSDIGKDLNVNIQETILIPKGTKSKISDENNIYTLHKFLPGKSLLSALKDKDLGKEFDINFKFNPQKSKNSGNYTSERRRLDMALKHKDLSKIYAFGKAFSNFDMHQDNIWYDKNKNKFSLIDNGESLNFISDFSSLKNEINKIKNDKTKQKNLKILTDTFEDIEFNHKPEKINKKLDYFLDKSLGTNTNKIELNKAKLNIARKKLVYSYNYNQIQKLNKDLYENK